MSRNMGRCMQAASDEFSGSVSPPCHVKTEAGLHGGMVSVGQYFESGQ